MSIRFLWFLMFFLACKARPLSFQEYDRIVRAKECEAEQSGVKWIMMPPDGAGAIVTIRRVVGEEFDVRTPRGNSHIRAGYSGWKKFVVAGAFEWKGGHPDLVCEGEVWYLSEVVDTAAPCKE